MQRPPYNPGFPNNGPMGPNGFPGQGPPHQQGFGPGGPYPPGAHGPPGIPPGMPQQQNFNQQQQPGCFMPAATIRKISNTTPPKF